MIVEHCMQCGKVIQGEPYGGAPGWCDIICEMQFHDELIGDNDNDENARFDT